MEPHRKHTSSIVLEAIEKVLEGARNIVKWKKELKSKTPFIVFQFLVVKPNEHQIEDVKKLAEEIGVDEVRFKTAQIYDYENDPNNLIPTIEKYSRYKKTERQTEFKKLPIIAGGYGMTR